MKVDLLNAAFCGEWCSEEEKFEITYWFEKSSFQFFYTGKLIDEFGYKDCAEIESSGHFIPVFKTDIITLQKDFIANYHNKEIEETINNIIEKDNYGYDLGYEVAFRILTQDFPEYDDFAKEYYAFEKKQLKKDAEKWCRENNIPYYVPYDEELKVDLNYLCRFVLYYKDDKFGYTEHWLDKKNFHIIGSSRVRANYGYQNNSEILKSGQFVQLFKREVIEMEKEYVAICHGWEMEKAIEMFLKENKECSFEDAFCEFVSNTELRKSWNEYMQSQLIKEAKQWCIENNIPYFIPKDKPDHLGSKHKNNT